MTDDLLCDAIRQVRIVYEEFETAETSLELLDVLLRQSPLPLMVGNDEQLLAASRSFMTLLGHTWHRRESVAWSEILHPDNTGSPFGSDQRSWRCRRYDGSYVDLSVWISPPSDQGVRVVVGAPSECRDG